MVQPKQFAVNELKTIYYLLKSIDEDLIINPSEDWELDHYEDSLIDKKTIKILLKKIEKFFTKEEFKEVKKNILQRKYSTFNNDINEQVYRIIERAYNKGKTIRINYFNMERGEPILREVDVYHKTRKYIIAYCHLRKAMRKFRTSRIMSAKFTNKTYIIPEDFDKNNY